MATQGEGGGKDEIKTQFVTREGTYKLMALSEYSKPNRSMYNPTGNTPVKVSFITLNEPSGPSDRICFNTGRELYFYVYKGVRKAVDLTKPIDKRTYKGTSPTCHDFNLFTATADSVMLLVGFTAGQVQLIDPIRKVLSNLYNEERLIDKTKVTCIKWIPHSPNQFIASHGSGQMYVYNEELPCGTMPPTYQTFKQGDGYAIYTCKTKSTRNPLYRWVVGEGSLNEFAFSPCTKYIATVSQDGYLRVFEYNSMDLVGSMKSYFGGLLCVSWSPDGKYIVTGGEDDLVTVWSFAEKRVVCRGQGHKSWVNVVSFDPYTTSLGDLDPMFDFNGSDDDFIHKNSANLLQETLRASTRSNQSKGSKTSSNSQLGSNLLSYRFGSVGQDTHMCLWDLTEDILRQPMGRCRTSTIVSQNANSGASGQTKLSNASHSQGNSVHTGFHGGRHIESGSSTVPHQSSATTKLTQKFNTLSTSDKTKEHKRNISSSSNKDKSNLLRPGNKSSDKAPLLKANHVKPVDDALRLLGTNMCPCLDEVPLLEPLVCKKIAHERLTSLTFKEECIVTACHEGYVCTWARPGKVGLAQQTTGGMSSPPTQHSSPGSTAL